jgi:hypothetical protein
LRAAGEQNAALRRIIRSLQQQSGSGGGGEGAGTAAAPVAGGGQGVRARHKDPEEQAADATDRVGMGASSLSAAGKGGFGGASKGAASPLVTRADPQGPGALLGMRPDRGRGALPMANQQHHLMAVGGSAALASCLWSDWGREGAGASGTAPALPACPSAADPVKRGASNAATAAAAASGGSVVLDTPSPGQEQLVPAQPMETGAETAASSGHGGAVAAAAGGCYSVGCHFTVQRPTRAETEGCEGMQQAQPDVPATVHACGTAANTAPSQAGGTRADQAGAFERDCGGDRRIE